MADFIAWWQVFAPWAYDAIAVFGALFQLELWVVGGVVVFGLFWAGLFVANADDCRPISYPAPRSMNPQARGYAAEFTLSWWEYYRVRLASWFRWSFHWSDSDAVPPLARIANARRRGLIERKRATVERICTHDVGQQDAVLIHDAVRVPAFLNRDGRKNLKRGALDNPWVRQAMKQVICIMGNAGYLPLVHCYDHGNPNYIFHVKGIEETRKDEHRDYPHKLFFRAATVMPHYPFGPALFGKERARFDGTLAPDAVVFIMMEKPWTRTRLGPRLYFLDELETLLGKKNLANLRHKDFYIGPDQSIPGKNVFGSVDAIQLFGVLKRTVKYMRFDHARIESALSTSRRDFARNAIEKLRNILDRKNSAAVWHADMARGDILIINNWRVASAWDEKCWQWETRREWSWAEAYWRDHRDVSVKVGDRVVFQMHFYLPRPIDPPEATGDEGLDCREVDIKGTVNVNGVVTPGEAVTGKVEVDGRVRVCELDDDNDS